MGNSILIIDDSESIRRQVMGILKEFQLFDTYYEAESGIEGFKILLNNKIDLILLDLIMPGMDGFKVLSMKRSKPEYEDIPVLMLTGEEDQKNKIKGLEQGASDYITKPFNPGELIARVKVHLRIKTLQDELRAANVRLEELSNVDALTNVHNRRYFMNMIEKEFDRAQRYHSHISFVMVDIDNFKKFNDLYGHQTGDIVLVSVAAILYKGLRKHDVVARYGGEEFAIILPETDLPGAVTVSERYRKTVESSNFGTHGKPLSLTISLGVSHFPHPEILTFMELIRRADEALYKAKDKGRNLVVPADS
jgi:two-component system cell cycle response regulator